MAGELSINNLADTIRDRVRTQIVNVIPDEQIDKLIRTEWDNFFRPQERPKWSTESRSSQFEILVRAEIDKLLKEKVVETVRKEVARFNEITWDQNAKAYTERFVQEYATKALEGLGHRMAEEALRKLSQNLPY